MSDQIFELKLPETFNINVDEFTEKKDSSEVIDKVTHIDKPSGSSSGVTNIDELRNNNSESSREPGDYGLNEDDDYSESDSDEYKGYSDAAKEAINSIKEGYFSGLSEEDIPNDLTASQLTQLYKKANELYLNSIQNSLIEDVSSAAGEYSKYIEYLLNGGSPEAVKEALSFQDLIKLDPEEEENQKKLLDALFTAKGIPKDDIGDIIDNILDKGKGTSKAKEALEFFKKEEDAVLENYKQYEYQQRMLEKQRYDAYVNSIKSVVDRGEIANVKLSRRDQDNILNAMFSPTEIYEYQDPNTGKNVRTRVTKLQVLQQELQNSAEKQVAYALWLLNGSDFRFAKEQGKNEEKDSLRAILNARETKRDDRTEKNKFDKLINDLTKARG